MYDILFPLIKLGTIITSFYGQVSPKNKEVTEYEKLIIINQYFYFTQICILLTTIILITSFIKRLRSAYLFSLIVPNIIIYELIVITIYWSLYFISPVLILGPICMKKENYFLFNDFCLHVFPLIGLLILFIETPVYHDYRRYIINILFGIIYTLLLRYNKAQKGRYPYSFLDKMGNFKVAFIFIPCLLIVFSGFLYILISLSIRIRKWVNEVEGDYELK